MGRCRSGNRRGLHSGRPWRADGLPGGRAWEMLGVRKEPERTEITTPNIHQR
jgi:hypothetical protein